MYPITNKHKTLAKATADGRNFMRRGLCVFVLLLALATPLAAQEFTGNIGAFKNDTCSYEDWKIGLSYALPKDFTIGAFYTDTSSANRLCYGSVSEGGAYPRNIAKGTGTVYIQKTF